MGNRPKHQLAPDQLGLQPASLEALSQKYLFDGETNVSDVHARVARAIAAVEGDARDRAEARFREALGAGLTGGGRIMAGAGRVLGVTLINCFVEPIGDCMTGREPDGTPGIMTALAEAAETMRRGGGIGYNFSRIRPKGAYVKGTDSRASGPLSYMDTFDSMCGTVESAGSRRGAQMGVLDVSHPDVEDFITAKAAERRWKNFNVSIAISDAFMQALASGEPWQLVHAKRPHPDAVPQAFQRDDGLWVYKTVSAEALWSLITRTTYDYAEPGVIFIDRVNRANNLWYLEDIRASNPCGEQMLPPYGCCCLASTNLTRFVKDPFTPHARFDFEAFAQVVTVGARFLDNVLDATHWPLEAQQREAAQKRRIGLGYFGLGSAKMMLGIRYGSAASVAFTEAVGVAQRDAAYRASIELAKERGAFPLFDQDHYLAGEFVATLPADIRADIARYGIRNSHLLSIAPTGTMALTFGDNASNGIEPAFALTYRRRIRQPDNTTVEVDVEEHAYRLYRALGHDTASLPPAFVTAQDLTPEDHLVVMAAAQRYVDSSISKTINVPESIAFEAFGDVYRRAYELGCKSATTYRPSATRGAVLVAGPKGDAPAPMQSTTDPDRRLTIKPSWGVVEKTRRFPKRPYATSGHDSRIYEVRSQEIRPDGSPRVRFFMSISHSEDHTPFEVFVFGDRRPRCGEPLAKVLSKVMHLADPHFLAHHLEALKHVAGERFSLVMPDQQGVLVVPSAASAIAHLIEFRARELGYFAAGGAHDSPLLDAMASREEPRTGAAGGRARYFTIQNPMCEMPEDFDLVIKEAELPDGTPFPIAVTASGKHYRHEWDGVLDVLSIGMRVCDPKWISALLSILGDFRALEGGFWADVPGSDKQQCYPSLIAYVARLILGRYQAHGILGADGEPAALSAMSQMGLFEFDPTDTAPRATGIKNCPQCLSHMSIRKIAGCETCECCGYLGSCG